MSARRKEFTAKIRLLAFARCAGKCESCKATLKVGEGEYDHITSYALSEDSSLSNCQVLCVPCHRGVGAKTAQDQKRISKAKRTEAKHIGARPAPAKPLQSAPFPQTEKAAARQTKTPLPPRQLYQPAPVQEMKP
jgi:hypothetical protein